MPHGKTETSSTGNVHRKVELPVPIFEIVIGDAEQARRRLAQMRRQFIEGAVSDIENPKVREREAQVMGEDWDANLRRPI
jgi:hypothetical protein